MTSVAPAPRSDAPSHSPWLPALAAATGAGVAAFLGLGAPGTVAVVALAALAPSLLGLGRAHPKAADPGSSASPAAAKQSASELVHLVADHVPDAVLFF